MNITSWYQEHFESALKGRFITLDHLLPVMKLYHDLLEITIVGKSELGKEIPMLKIGSGKKVVLGWSQMHGNESTTTKALFDFLQFLGQKEEFQLEIKMFLKRYTLFLIPILNPDGALLYTRENSNLVDLNRDAQELTQSESLVLDSVFKELKPDLCLNMHDQRSIYGFENGNPATISFLAPSADKDRSITASRIVAMEHIVRMNKVLQSHIPGQVGRYNDSFNANCVGDTCQMAAVPTILFEAGHYADDYQREKTRELVFYALLELFEINGTASTALDHKDYFAIPENKVNYKDMILRNVRLGEDGEPIDLGIQYTEVLSNESILFEAHIDTIGECDAFYGHREIDIKGDKILINSQENIYVGQKVLNIVRKNDNSDIIY